MYEHAELPVSKGEIALVVLDMQVYVEHIIRRTPRRTQTQRHAGLRSTTQHHLQ